jgi:hypothetical protein
MGATAALAIEAKEQAQNTNTLGKAAQDANGIANTASTAVQRAFIVVDHLDISAVRAPNGQVERWIVNPVVTNSGNTPTVNLYFSIGFGGSGDMTGRREPPFDPGNFLPLTDIRRHDNPGLWRRGIVGPHTSVTNFTVLNGFMAETLRNPPGGWTNTGQYIWGAFVYGDVFDGRPKHITEFCFVMARTTMVGDQFAPYQRCNHHNCADAECEAEEREHRN